MVRARRRPAKRQTLTDGSSADVLRPIATSLPSSSSTLTMATTETTSDRCWSSSTSSSSSSSTVSWRCSFDDGVKRATASRGASPAQPLEETKRNICDPCCIINVNNNGDESLTVVGPDDDRCRRRGESNVSAGRARLDGISNYHRRSLIINHKLTLIISLYLLSLTDMCLLYLNRFVSIPLAKLLLTKKTYRARMMHVRTLALVVVMAFAVDGTHAFGNDFDKSEPFLDKINLEQSIAAVFNKVAYGSTTKRSIPDTAYPVTTLATPLLTTYRYSDGSNEWLSVDVKKPDHGFNGGGAGRNRGNYDAVEQEEENREFGYGADLEKDHALPTSAPAADILKNNNNRNYENPNRYNNDRLRPDVNWHDHGVTESAVQKSTSTTTTGGYNVLRNVRPTKSIYSKDIPSYVPPSRAFFTPPLPPEYLSPFADKPTLRGTNSDGFVNKRPFPPPSLMPSKDRIPFMPPSKVNVERVPITEPRNDNGNNNSNNSGNHNNSNNNNTQQNENNKKKSLNTPSQNANLDRLGHVYGLNRNANESNFEYEKDYLPSITRILSGSNGRHDDISDILLRTVTATPNVQRPADHGKTAPKSNRAPPTSEKPNKQHHHHQQQPQQQESSQREPDADGDGNSKQDTKPSAAETAFEDLPTKKEIVASNPGKSENDATANNSKKKDHRHPARDEFTTQISDLINLPNRKEKNNNNANGNVTKANSEEIWTICWNVHVYLVVVSYVLLAACSIYKLIRYENDPHMFSKSYFLTIHLMLTVICVLRIFYLTYDPYNVYKSFNIFLYDFLHNFPLSLLATTFAVLILFLLKRTLTHLKVKTRPVFLVLFGVMHIFLCFCLSISETLGHFERASLIVCRPVFVLLAWALGVSYLYLYKIIKNVLAKKSQNLSEMCTQNISYASHITIAVALLFVLLGCVQLYALFFIKVDRFNGEIKHHWILWGFELSVRLLEISIITLLAIVVSLKMSQREKQTVGFPLFPCTTSDSSTDNIYPNNCNTNPNALNYSRNEMIMDNLPTEPIDRPNNLVKNAFQNDSFDKKSTLERYQSDGERSNNGNFDRFERPNWANGSDRFDAGNNGVGRTANVEPPGLNNLSQQQQQQQPPQQPSSGHFDRASLPNSARNSNRNAKTYESAKYYAKPKYDVEFNGTQIVVDDEDDDTSSSYQREFAANNLHHPPHHHHHHQSEHNVYSEPIDQSSSTMINHHQYERTRHDFERGEFDRRGSGRNSSNTSGRRSTGRTRKNHARPHLGVQTLPNHDGRQQHQLPDSVLVEDQGFLRFKMQEYEHENGGGGGGGVGVIGGIVLPKRNKKQGDVNHYSDA